MPSISEANPFDRLLALTAYMSRWIEEWPKPTYGFSEYVWKRFPHIIPGTVEHAKSIATHCYYCNIELVDGGKIGNAPNRASIDHYQPKSKGKTDRYVICCAQCNSNKDNISPESLVAKITRASLRGNTMWGFHGKKLKTIADQIQKITNDILYNMGPRIYFFKR